MIFGRGMIDSWNLKNILGLRNTSQRSIKLTYLGLSCARAELSFWVMAECPLFLKQYFMMNKSSQCTANENARHSTSQPAMVLMHSEPAHKSISHRLGIQNVPGHNSFTMPSQPVSTQEYLIA
jgi:hypothetical protein